MILSIKIFKFFDFIFFLNLLDKTKASVQAPPYPHTPKNICASFLMKETIEKLIGFFHKLL